MWFRWRCQCRCCRLEQWRAVSHENSDGCIPLVETRKKKLEERTVNDLRTNFCKERLPHDSVPFLNQQYINFLQIHSFTITCTQLSLLVQTVHQRSTLGAEKFKNDWGQLFPQFKVPAWRHVKSVFLQALRALSSHREDTPWHVNKHHPPPNSRFRRQRALVYRCPRTYRQVDIRFQSLCWRLQRHWGVNVRHGHIV